MLAAEQPRLRKGSSQLFNARYSVSKIKWWHETIPGALWNNGTYSHLNVLQEMIDGSRSADDAESLDHCYRRCVDDQARSVSGRWCVCLKEEWSAGEFHGQIGGDGKAALVSVRADLEHALDELPIGWRVVSDLYAVQGREGIYQQRYTAWRRGLSNRDVDRESEPIDPETRRPMSRQLCWYLMSYVLSCAPIAPHGCHLKCSDQHRGEGIAWKYPRKDEADTSTFLAMINSLAKMPQAA